jgi:hypothetical protein
MEAPHSCPPAQVPQSSVPSHPSPVWPQSKESAAHVVVVQLVPQTLGDDPPPHVWPGVVHAPQSRTQPQPSPIWPQSKPFDAQVTAPLHLPQPPEELVLLVVVSPPPTPPTSLIPVRAPHAAARATTHPTAIQKAKR